MPIHSIYFNFLILFSKQFNACADNKTTKKATKRKKKLHLVPTDTSRHLLPITLTLQQMWSPKLQINTSWIEYAIFVSRMLQNYKMAYHSF